jgi:hypothetical protein
VTDLGLQIQRRRVDRPLPGLRAVVCIAGTIATPKRIAPGLGNRAGGRRPGIVEVMAEFEYHAFRSIACKLLRRPVEIPRFVLQVCNGNRPAG